MSELQTRFIDDTYVEYYNTGKHELVQIYLKSEVDKVIAGKDAEIASLNREIANIQDKMCEDVFEGIMPSEHIVCLPLQQAAEYIAELKAQKAQTEDDCAYWKAKAQRGRHANYKRCLAMAKWCKLKRIDAADYRIQREKWEFYDKWHKRWLELAEKFKEAK